MKQDLERLEIVKSNDVVQNISKRKYELTLPEQRILCYIISKLDRKQAAVNHSLELEFDRKDFCHIAGIRACSKNYQLIEIWLERLASNGFWIKDRGKLYFQWITTPEIYDNGRITVTISNKVIPYLLDLKERFTRYKLYQVLAFKSGYSIAIYELCKSYLFMHEFEISLEDLRNYLGIPEDKYDNYRNFRAKVINVAAAEINELSDITVSFNNIKDGRNIIGYTVDIQEKKSWDGLEAYSKTMEKLNK